MGVTESSALTAPANIQFINQSIGDEIISYSWSFGDGTSSSTISPSHVYTTAGNYTVTLVVENEAGESSKSQNITISSYSDSSSSPDDFPEDEMDKYNGDLDGW